MSMCVRVSIILSSIYDIIRRCLHALVRAVVTPEEEKGQWAMEELLTPRQQTARQIKARFLEALQTNNVTEVLEILYTTNLDIDTVLEVEDKRMVLASYKQGGNVNKPSQSKDEETPLHTAARLGIPELVALYISHGAQVDAVNSLQETPLITAAFWALDIREQTYSEDHHLVCRILLDHGADPNLYEDDYKTALHKASWNCDHVLMQMLLEAGADTTTMDINGCEPIQYVLKVTSVRPMAIPELCYQLLLNFGAPRVYPPQFHKVLQACHECPNAVEVMMNSYERIKPTNKWRSSISEASYKQHEEFYESMFAVCSNTPRCLMHLARCAVRRAMENRCHTGVGTLPLPPPIQRYLLLEPEGTFY
ncbi:ankyrin repeat and SOCS box protein 4 isoform 2-T2 [Salvelinus alpinus]